MSPRDNGGPAVAERPAGEDARRPPHNHEAEVSVCAAPLLDSDAIYDVPWLRGEHYFHEGLGIIWDAERELDSSGEAVDVVTLSDKLRADGNLERIGGLPALAELTDAVPTAANIEHHARIIRNSWTLRQIVEAARETLREAWAADSRNAREVLDAAETRLLPLSEDSAKSGAGDTVRVGDIVLEALDESDAARENPDAAMGVRTGITKLDDRLRGAEAGDFIVIGGRPSQGKTALALLWACHAAAEEGGSVLLFSLEMHRKSVTNRLLALESGVSYRSIVTGRWEKESREEELLVSAAGRLRNASLSIHDRPGLTPLEVRSVARRHHRRQGGGLDLVIVDYLQLMSSGQKAENRQLEVARMSRRLKQLARELEVPVIALSQLSRAPEERRGGRPRLSDLRSSGAIEQDADKVAMIWRPVEYLGPTYEGRDISDHAEALVVKARNGATGSIPLRFEGETMRFRPARMGTEPLNLSGGGR